MKKPSSLLGLLLVATPLVFGPCAFAADETAPPDNDSAYTSISVFSRALQLIRQDYVDDKKISFHDLTYSALRGMLSALDPHSQFMAPEDFKGMEDDTKSQFGGLGIVVSSKDGNLTIVAPMEDTPAMKAGLEPGDRVVKVDGQSTDKIGVNAAMQMLRGDVGQKVTLTIFRPFNREVKDYTLERAIIKVASVKDAKILPAELAGNFKVGYVRITQFNEPTADELGKALDSLQAQGMQALVLDLRFNPGGLLSSAVDVCGQFLPPNTMVVSTEGRTPSQSKIYRTSEDGKPRADFPLAILVNGASASGAEIVSGALKDLNRAILVGETTFGKGSVQSVIELPDGSALRLTTAKYYTPSHQVIHEHGVTPTIRAVMTDQQDRQLLALRREEQPDELGENDQPVKLTNFHDTQLERAVDALKGVIIYAGRSGTPVKMTVQKAEAVHAN
jgi:carboxyl-terminal processing protease